MAAPGYDLLLTLNQLETIDRDYSGKYIRQVDFKGIPDNL